MPDTQINQPLPQVELSFHDRAAIVCNDILAQIGFDDEKMRMIVSITSTLNMLPPIGPIGQAQKVIKEIEPLLFAAQTNRDPLSYIQQIPEQKIEYFINQVITRLEWVKYGNEDPEAESAKKAIEYQAENTNIPEHS